MMSTGSNQTKGFQSATWEMNTTQILGDRREKKALKQQALLWGYDK